MKKILFATAGLAALAVGMTAASAADLPRRSQQMPVKAVPYVSPVYNWTGAYVGINGGGAFGGRTGFGARATGALVGGTLGYNWQSGQAVFGLETDLDWTNIKGTGNSVLGFPVETKNDYLGTVRGRLGYAADRALFYVTGGLAYGNVKSNTVFGSASETKAGWTLGGGLEYAIAGPWTAKVEYLYVDLGRGATLPITGESSRFSTNVVRAGLNYRF